MTSEKEIQSLPKDLRSCEVSLNRSLIKILQDPLKTRISVDLNLLFEKNPKRKPNQPGLKLK